MVAAHWVVLDKGPLNGLLLLWFLFRLLLLLHFAWGIAEA